MSIGTIRAVPEKADLSKVVLKPVSWTASIGFIKHLILGNNVLISLLGEPGSGKTTFANLLRTELSPQIKCDRITASSFFDRAMLLQQLNFLLEIRGAPSISNCIAKCNEQQFHRLIIIDDAHFLSAVVIEELLKELQQQGGDGYFHVCLISNFSLVPTLNSLADEAYVDMVHSIELGALTENETKTYVVQNVLPIAGAEKVITDERVKQFYELTEGHLDKINQKMSDFFCYMPGSLSKNVKFLRYGGVASAAVIAVLGMVYLGVLQEVQPPPAQLVKLESPNPRVAETRIEPIFSSSIPTYDVAAARHALQATDLRRVELAAMDDDDNGENQATVVMDKVVVAPKIITTKSKAGVVAKTTGIKGHTASVAIKKPTRMVGKRPVAKIALTKLAASHGQYTIQLLASRNRGKLQRFVETQPYNPKLQIRRSLRQGKPWYVLTLGEYPQRGQAKQAIHSLPKGLAQYQPWVRMVSEIKASG